MGKPAARLGDMHVCPKVEPGPVLQGSPDVLIDYMPAARVGDAALCIGPTDTISAGSATVFINGKPAARMGDSCAHGGKIIIGSPTVIIGDRGGGASGFQGSQQVTQTNDLSSEDGFTVEDGSSLALDFLPVISNIKSFGQLITGTDLVTGEQISRGMETVGIAAGIFPGGKGIFKGITKGAKVLGKSDDVADVAKAAGKVDVIKGIKNTEEAIGIGTKNVITTPKQLQKKFKHAEDFGVSGNYSPNNAKKFNEAIQNHLNAPGTKEISGSYRGNPVTFHTDPKSGLTVIQKPNGAFLSGWKLNPQQQQYVLKNGKL